MTTTWLADVLRAEGCQVNETGGWQTRGRPGSYAPFGVLNHHTASNTSYQNPAPTLNLCINGRSDLPGPLCHVMIGYDGVCHIVAAGRANHAGSARSSPPVPAGDGNTMLVGFEWDYSGYDPPSPEQYRAAVLANAAVLRQMGYTADYAKGHIETSTEGKWDPGQVDLEALRADVASQLAGGYGPAPTQETRKMVLTDEISGGVWVLAPDGAIYTYDGAPYLGGTNNPECNADGYPAYGIADHGDGYVIVMDWGDDGTGHSPAGGGDRFRRYHFPRDGSGIC